MRGRPSSEHRCLWGRTVERRGAQRLRHGGSRAQPFRAARVSAGDQRWHASCFDLEFRQRSYDANGL